MSTQIDLSNLSIDQILALQEQLKARREAEEAAMRAHLATLVEDAVTEIVTSGVKPTQGKSGSVYWSVGQIPITIDGDEYSITMSVFDVKATKAGKARVKAGTTPVSLVKA